jgi:hypothetical protein
MESVEMSSDGKRLMKSAAELTAMVSDYDKLYLAGASDDQFNYQTFDIVKASGPVHSYIDSHDGTNLTMDRAAAAMKWEWLINDPDIIYAKWTDDQGNVKEYQRADTKQ